jgi:hypothetical protein
MSNWKMKCQLPTQLLIPLPVSRNKFRSSGAMCLRWLCVQACSTRRPFKILFQVYLFLVKPCCCRVAPHAHYPRRADIGREGWALLVMGDLLWNETSFFAAQPPQLSLMFAKSKLLPSLFNKEKKLKAV